MKRIPIVPFTWGTAYGDFTYLTLYEHEEYDDFYIRKLKVPEPVPGWSMEKNPTRKYVESFMKLNQHKRKEEIAANRGKKIGFEISELGKTGMTGNVTHVIQSCF